MRFSKALISCGAMAALGTLGSYAGAQQPFGGVTGGVFNFNGTTLTASGTSTAFTFLSDSVTGPTQFAGDVKSGVFTLSATVSSVKGLSGGKFIANLSGLTESITSGGYNLVSTLGPTSGARLIGLGNGRVLFSLGGNDLFTSDYFALAGFQSESLTLSSSTTPTVSGNSLSSFSANLLGGTFRSSSVPEASTLIGLGGLVFGGGLLGLRRRKA